jgi:predicted kinase
MSVFDHILVRWPWLRDLEACPQDPEWHQEGNVLTHTRMVVEAVDKDDVGDKWAWGSPPGKITLIDAAVLHDVGKPATTRTDPDGRITSKRHSLVGSIISRQRLYEAAYSFRERELIAGLVRWHQVPFHAVGSPTGAFMARLAAETCPHYLLSTLAWADAKGRVCDKTQESLDAIDLYKLYGEEVGVDPGPYPFPSDATRVKYYQDRGAFPPDLWLPEPKGSRVTVMAGLPGSGKSRWLKDNALGLPVVSLDALREEMDMEPTGNQGAVVQAAKEQSREFLRVKQDFAWDATNLSRDIRDQVISLFLAYDARVRIVYVEVPLETLKAQNANREHVVPWSVIQRMMTRWELPSRTEAHEVVYVVRS